MLTRYDQREILTSLHAGVLEKPLWSTFLERLARGMDAEGCSLAIRQSDAAVAEATEFVFHRDGASREQPTEPAAADSFDPIPYEALRPGRVYALDEFLLPDDPRHQVWLRERIVPAGRRHLRIMRINSTLGHVAWLTVWRGSGRFSAADASFLSDLAPHLVIAFDIFATIERERIRAGIGAEAVRRMNFGWLTLDARGRVIDIDEHAEELLRRGKTLTIHARGRLTPASREADRALTEALREFESNPQARARAIRLSDDPWLDMLLVPVSEEGRSATSGQAATAFLHGDNELNANRMALFGELFRLTPSEARFALLIAHGRSIAEAARELGITEQTARGYSKIIYGKTGARGQADLVRIILASVANLG